MQPNTHNSFDQSTTQDMLYKNKNVIFPLKLSDTFQPLSPNTTNDRQITKKP